MYININFDLPCIHALHAYHRVRIQHRNRHNSARFVFGNGQFEEFMVQLSTRLLCDILVHVLMHDYICLRLFMIVQKTGRECGEHAEFFIRSVKEAESFITAKCNKGHSDHVIIT